MTVRACLFDMDGVIRHWDPGTHDAVERLAGVPEGALLEAAFGVPEYHNGVLGLVTYEQWCDATEAALAAHHGAQAARTLVAAMRADRGRIDPEAVRLVREVSASVPVALFSNAHDRLVEDLRHHGLGDVFGTVFCSATEKLAKPDPQFYRHAADRLGLPPNAIFFTDDLEENVAAARVVGLQAHLFQNVPALRRQLVAAGVLGPGSPSPHRPGPARAPRASRVR